MTRQAEGCLICHGSSVAVVALFLPDGGGPPIPYALCVTCWQASSPHALAELVGHLLTARTP